MAHDTSSSRKIGWKDIRTPYKILIIFLLIFGVVSYLFSACGNLSQTQSYDVYVWVSTGEAAVTHGYEEANKHKDEKPIVEKVEGHKYIVVHVNKGERYSVAIVGTGRYKYQTVGCSVSKKGEQNPILENKDSGNIPTASCTVTGN